MTNLEIFDKYESEVRGYVRGWPTVFESARDAELVDEDGKKYIDFFAGAGVVNYGHNNPEIKQHLIDYLQSDNIIHGLDMATSAKAKFLETFQEVILKPREFDYKVQFPGPTGTNSVEAALKLARKYTGRSLIIGFTNGFHGMTLGSLSVTGNEMKRRGAGVPLHHSVSMPFEDFFGEDVNTIDYLRGYLRANGSGVEAPAAIIVESVQAEGGVHTASMDWLRQLSELAHEYGALFILDDIQAGNGRTGKFFSFEEAGIVPDIVCLSKSLSGIGLPLAVDLIRPELDVWDPGEHNGTFRGYNPAFVTATATLNRYWRDDALTRETHRKADKVRSYLEKLAEEFPEARGEIRGRGLIQGFYSPVPGLADEVAKEAFKRQLVIETSGPNSEVLKLLPPLTIDDETLDRGLEIIRESMRVALPERLTAEREERDAVAV